MNRLWIQGTVAVLAVTLASGVGFAGANKALRGQRKLSHASTQPSGDRAEMRKKIIEKFDKDGDGKLNDEERAAAKEEIQKHRKSGDGELRKKIIEKFDKDGDGKLNDEECAAAKEAMKEHHKNKSAPTTQSSEK